jgi:hypothetical protein
MTPLVRLSLHSSTEDTTTKLIRSNNNNNSQDKEMERNASWNERRLGELFKFLYQLFFPFRQLNPEDAGEDSWRDSKYDTDWRRTMHLGQSTEFINNPDQGRTGL